MKGGSQRRLFALRMAAELGIDLRQVAGSGPGGRIIKRDIEAYVQENAKKPEKKTAAAHAAHADPVV